jgi:hypothetical protein
VSLLYLAETDDSRERQATYQHRQVIYHNRLRARFALRYKCLNINTQRCTPKLVRAKLNVRETSVPSKRGRWRKDIMKTSMLVKAAALLTIGSAFPLGAIASPPAKTMTERGMIEKVNTAKKEFALKGGSLDRTANFEWNASTQFVETGKPAAASELKMGEHATVNYASHGNQRVATRIAISPSGETAQAPKAQAKAPKKESVHNYKWLDT